MTLVCRTGTVAPPFLAQNLEDEYIERGLRCHIEIQVQSEHDELCVGHEVQEKTSPLPPPLKGRIWRRNLGKVWDLETAPGLQVPHPVIITTFLTRGKCWGERGKKVCSAPWGWKCFIPQKPLPGSCAEGRRSCSAPHIRSLQLGLKAIEMWLPGKADGHKNKHPVCVWRTFPPPLAELPAPSRWGKWAGVAPVKVGWADCKANTHSGNYI